MRCSTFLLTACTTLLVHAQPGALDLTFNPDGTGPDNEVRFVHAHPDGGFIVSGLFGSYNGEPRPGLAKLHSDGTLDDQFVPQLGQVNWYADPLVLPDGRVVVATSDIGLVRLLADGSVDPTFHVDSVGGYAIGCVALQPDGKLVVGGYFWSPFRRVMRVNEDGTLDATFDPGTGIEGLTGWVSSIAVQPDGKLILGGGMSGFNGEQHQGLVRLMPDGQVDHSFTSGLESLGYGANVHQVVLQPDGRILVGGGFSQMNGVPAGSIARLLPDGTVDPSFITGAGFDADGTSSQTFHAHVWNMAVQPDGRILMGGLFSSYNGVPCSNIIRLLSNGTLDAGFSTGSGCDMQVSALALQDGKVLVGGSFTGYNGTPREHLIRLRALPCMTPELVSTGTEASCGLTDVYLDGTTTLWATEVPGADEYSFSLIDADGQSPAVNITLPTRALVLAGPDVAPLQPDHTYAVSVEVNIGGEASPCGAGPACGLHISPFAGSVSTGIFVNADAATGVAVWPNPNTGDRLYLAVGGFDPSLDQVHVNVLDPAGRCVMRTTINATQGAVNGTLPLNAAIADGPYVLDITAGERHYAQRLMIQR